VAVTIYPNCNDIVAHLPGVRAAVYDTAQDGAAKARAILSAHRYQGHSQITVTRGAVDSFVNLDDTRGQHAAAAIEYGRSGGENGPATQGVGALAGAF
jgi:hypothetical protein